MAVKEEVLIEISLDDADNEKQVDKLTKSIVDLQDEVKELTKQNKELAAAGKVNSKEFMDNSKQLEISKQKISENSASRKNLILAIRSEDDSIKELRIRNAEMIKQRDLISTKTDEGKKKIQELNKQIDANNETIKENSSKLEQQKFNIGNYSGAIDKLVPGLGGWIQAIYDMTQASGGFIGALKGMTKAAWAFVATPIGAILTAIVAVLSLLTSYFKSSGDGADRFAKISKQLSAIVDVLVDRIASFVRALIAFSSGNWNEAGKQLTNTFAGLGDELEREIQLAGELADALDLLEDQQKDYEVALSTTANLIKELIIQAKDRTLTEEERIKLLDKALALERQANTQLLALREEALRISTEEAAMRANMSRKEGETLEQFAKRLIQNEQLADDLRDGVRDALKNLNQAIGESLNLQEKIDNKINDLEQKREDRRRERQKREMEEAEEARQIRIERLEAELEHEHELYVRRQEFIQEFHLNVQSSEERMLNHVAKIRADQRAKQLEAEKKAAEAQKKIDDFKNEAIIGGIELVTKERSAARVALTAIFKADAIKETTINTYNAAVAAYKSLAGIPYVGPILGGFAAAAITAYGLASIAKMTGIQFAKGGLVAIGKFARGGQADKRGTFEGPSHAGGGVTYYRSDGRHAINVEGGENFYVLKKSASDEINNLSALNQRHGGASWNRSPVGRYAAGGYVSSTETRNATRIASQQTDIRALANSINQVRTVLVLQDFEAAAASKNEPIARAEIV